MCFIRRVKVRYPGALVTVTPDNLYLLRANHRMEAVLSISTGETLRCNSPDLDLGWEYIVTPDGLYVIGSSWLGMIRVLSLLKGEELRSIYCRDIFPGSVTTTLDGQYIVGSDSGGKIHSWSFSTGERTLTIDAPYSAPVYRIVFTASGFILTQTGCENDNVVTIWSPNWERLHHIRTSLEYVRGMRVSLGVLTSPGGEFMVARDRTGVARVWSIRSGNQLGVINVPMEAAAFTPDGQYIVVGGTDGYIRLLSLPTCEQVYVIEAAHRKEVSQLEVSADGRFIMSIGDEKVVSVRSVLDGHKVYEFGDTEAWQDVTMKLSPDGQHIICCVDDLDLSIWSSTLYLARAELEDAHRLLSVAQQQRQQHQPMSDEDCDVNLIEMATLAFVLESAKVTVNTEGMIQ